MSLFKSAEPYPGLRAFRREEADIFFGRDDHIDDLVDKLAVNRFICITGPSGSGKSSLAKTGLMTALEAGFLPGCGMDWLFLDLRPGEFPIRRLQSELIKQLVSEDASDAQRDDVKGRLAKALLEGVHDIREIFDRFDVAKGRPVLVLIDQFEELFRFATKRDEIVKFIDILLKTAEPDNDVFIAITIRTDQIERCVPYASLTEAINKSQFLTPVPDRFQLQEAIEAPVRLFGGKVEQDLSVFLLNSAEGKPDRLPLLQHTLKLLYTTKIEGRSKEGAPFSISLANLHALAEELGIEAQSNNLLGEILSKKLDATVADLADDLKPLVPRLFCELVDTKRAPFTRDIRRPQSVQSLEASLGADDATVERLIKPFSQGRERYLIRNQEDNIDVTHECVLRQWSSLTDLWLQNEQSDVWKLNDYRTYAERYKQSMARWKAPVFGEYLSGSEIKKYHEWLKTSRANETWGARHLREATKVQIAEAAINAPGTSLEETSKQVFKSIGEMVRGSEKRETFLKSTAVLGVALVAVAIIWLNSALDTSQDQRQQLSEFLGEFDFEESYAGATSLYDQPLSDVTNCGDPNSLCSRLLERNEPEAFTALILAAEEESLCETTQALWDRIGSASAETDTSQYPDPLCEAAPVGSGPLPGSQNTLEQIRFDYANAVATSADDQSIARRVFYGMLARSRPTSRAYDGLALNFLRDDRIALDRRLYEVNACARRSIEILCQRQGVTARTIYIETNEFVQQIVPQYSRPIVEALEDPAIQLRDIDFVGDRAAANLLLSNQLFDERMLAPMQDGSSWDEETTSAAWRAMDAASDAARIIARRFDCGVGNEQEAACALSQTYYARAAALLSQLIELGSQSIAPRVQAQINFGVGVAALHWGQDQRFREASQETGLPLPAFLRELRKADNARSSLRYSIGLGMLYCFDEQFDRAREAVIPVLDASQSKYTAVRNQVRRCERDFAQIEILFERSTPSE